MAGQNDQKLSPVLSSKLFIFKIILRK